MNRKIGIKTAVALVLCASALTCVIIFVFFGLYMGYGTDMFGEIRTYIALRNDIKDVYIGAYDSKEISEAALAATVTALEDQWSYYMTPEEYKDYIEASNNQYSGLGISVRLDDTSGGLAIMGVFEGSPAEKAGIAVGDIISAVDGVDITELSLQEASDLIDRQIGETVRLTLMGADGSLREVTAEYALIDTKSVSYEMIDSDIGYIKIRNFEAGTANGFTQAADALIEKGAKAFVFDVRNNGGGRVTELKEMLDYLLPECEIFVSVDKSGREDVSMSDAGNVKLPSVVLVNGHSYSAAEYFAACLQEYSYASVVGQHTTGKNRSQITIDLPDGGALHISSGEYLTPGRVSLTEQGGINPDDAVVLSDENNILLYNGHLSSEEDTQLQKALEMLRQS